MDVLNNKHVYVNEDKEHNKNVYISKERDIKYNKRLTSIFILSADLSSD